MSKVLQDGRIQVEAGDTLSGIYGANWKQISGYTGDPTTLPIGTILPAKQAGSLAGTLNQDITDTQGKTLPGQPMDNLSMFQDVLKTVTARAAQEAKASGGAALPEGMLKPSEVSGQTFADIMGMVTEAKTRGISDIYQSTIDMIENSRIMAQDQLQTLISTGGIANLDDTVLKGLSDTSGYGLDLLKAMRTEAVKTKEENDNDDDKDDYNSNMAIDYVMAELSENSDITDEELFLSIKEGSKLSVTEINKAIEVGREKYSDEQPEQTFEDTSKQAAAWAEKAKESGQEKDEVKNNLIAKYKAGLDLGTSDTLPDRYINIIDEIVYAVFGPTLLDKIIPGWRGSGGMLPESLSRKVGIPQFEMRERLGLDKLE